MAISPSGGVNGTAAFQQATDPPRVAQRIPNGRAGTFTTNGVTAHATLPSSILGGLLALAMRTRLVRRDARNDDGFAFRRAGDDQTMIDARSVVLPRMLRE